MATPSNDKKLHQLARVRENQRRSRARKQEYIQDLEKKLSQCRAEASHRDIEQRISIQTLKTENEKLRHLLSDLGVQSSSIEAYLRQGSDKVMKWKVAIPALQKTEPSIQIVKTPQSDCCSGIRSEPTSQRVVQNNTDDAIPIDQDDHRPAASTAGQKGALRTGINPHTLPDAPRQIAVLTPEPVDRQQDTDDSLTEFPVTAESISDCLCGTTGSFPPSDTAQDTILCAEAGTLIQQYNTLGVDISDIRTKLQEGFRKEVTTGEGCRVTNQALFRVLDEISGNLA